MSTTVSSTLTNMAAEQVQHFTFGAIDYVVFVVMLLISACIGIYFGFFSKAKNTTDEYLMGGKRMRTLPIAISLVASQLSGMAVMSVPAETYSFGICYVINALVLIVVIPILCYIIIPVFYENSISNCYEYLEMRFNKRTRQIVTATFIFNSFLMLPVWMFIPSLALAQVSGINVHIINSIVCFICVFYTMLGGIKAVVWTDVVQAGIMLTAVFAVGVLGIRKAGGLQQVIAYADKGGRMDINMSWDPRIRTTLWNTVINGILLWTGHIGLNQSCVQRIVSLPTIKHAQKSLKIAGIGMVAIMFTTSVIGVVMFARYYGCDPILAGLVQKADKLMPFFVQDIMGQLRGMPGVFISCVFSAALSTMSANLNSLAGVVYFDYVRPFIKHNDAHANYLMKLIVIAMGIYCVSAGLIVEHFTSMLQAIISITGTNTGAVVAIFLIGMFVPRVNGKVAVMALCSTLGLMFCLVFTAQLRLKRGDIVYEPLPTSLEQCAARNFTFGVLADAATLSSTDEVATATVKPLITTAFDSNRPFSVFEISFYWYKLVGATLFTICALAFSCIWPNKPNEKFNGKLFVPFIRKYLHDHGLEAEKLPLQSTTNAEQSAIVVEDKPNDSKS